MSYSTKKYKYSIEKKQYDQIKNQGILYLDALMIFIILLFNLTA